MTQLFLRGQVGIYRRTMERDRSVDAPGDPSLDAAVTSFWVRHHFGEGWAAELAVPMGQVTLRSPGTVPFRVSGFGDVTVGGRYDFAALWGLEGKRPSLALRTLLALPTAALATDSPSPDVPPTLLALGDGVFGAGATLVATQPLGEGFSLALPVSFQAPLSRASNGRRPGVTLAGSADLLYRPLPGLTLRAGASVESRGYADEQPAGTILNSGGVWWRAQAGITGVIAKRVVLGAGARVPFYMRVHGRQIAETVTANATLGFLWMPDEEEEEHDHDHGHDDHGHDDHGHDDHAEGDVGDLATGGESFALEGVASPGKLTVIDFWADWCHPCEHLDGMLRQLAAERSDLAVRRVEIVDFEQPVAEQWFPDGGALPQLWIVDEGGAVVERLEGDPPETMIDAVRRHLGP